MTAGVPAAVADLDLDMVTDALVRHACNVTDVAADLGVPASDLRRLLWANPRLQDAAFEVVEGRLDLAEKNIGEALRSDDGRVRMAASMFTLRNSARARSRGWITTSAANVEVNIEPRREIVCRWRNSNDDDAEIARLRDEGKTVVSIGWGNPVEPDGKTIDSGMETIERDGRKIEVPRYGGGRRDESDYVEGELTTPPAMIEHAVEPPELEPSEPPEPAVFETKPKLPTWPGPHPPPPLVAHLYAPYAPPPRVAPARPRR